MMRVIYSYTSVLINVINNDSSSDNEGQDSNKNACNLTLCEPSAHVTRSLTISHVIKVPNWKESQLQCRMLILGVDG
jgi:hypothetical protein